MVLAAVSFSGVVAWLFEHREIELWSFFFGLIVASAVFVGRSVSPWSTDRAALALAGVLAGAVVSSAGGLPVSEHPLVTFAAGAVAICAWILPGVSGSFVLLLLGQYQRVVRAVAELDLVVIASLGAGCAVGLVLFTRALTWLLRHAYGGTLAFLCGFMVGSLQKLWPWRQTLSYYLDSHGDAIPVVVRPIGPLRYEVLYGEDPMLLGAGLACIAGLGLVMALDLASRRSG
jgi:putative membrane protein